MAVFGQRSSEIYTKANEAINGIYSGSKLKQIIGMIWLIRKI